MSEEHNIPKNWHVKMLGEVCKLKNGFAFKSNDYIDEGVPVIRISDINKGIVSGEGAVRVKNKDEYESYLVEYNDILVAMSGATTGKFGIYKNKDKAYQNQRVGKFKIFDETILDNQFLFHQIHSLKRQIEKDAYGGAQPNISSNKIEQMQIVVPSLSEQQAIVFKIEELLSDLDNGKQQLQIAQQQLKIYRQSLLKWAFEGKLTEDWRKKQSKLQTGEQTLHKIKSERIELCKLNKIKTKPIQDISDDEFHELSKLPNEIVWTRLGDIVWSVKDGPHYSPKYQENGVPFISGGNIRPNGIDFEKVKYISKELHLELSKRCKPEKWDVLYTKGGTTGIARVNNYDIDFNVWVHVAVLKTVPSVNPFYLQHVLNSNHCYKQSQKYTHGVGNQDLGLTRMILITLPICSLEEQDQIVKELESNLTVCDKIEETISQSLLQAETLRQSILKRAFEGKLLTI